MILAEAPAQRLRSGHARYHGARREAALGERADRPLPRNGRDASLSVQHCCAIAFVEGAAGLRQFTDAAVGNPEVGALRQRVVLERDAAVGVEEAHVEVRMHSGNSFSKHVPHLRGSLQCPMSDAELETKLADQVALAAPGIDALVSFMQEFERKSG